MITKFLIQCSGANADILKECPTEKTKFIGIGATILMTALLAMLSGGYALYFTFNNFFIAAGFGILWGLVIFNLDRYIVSSIRKTGQFKKELWTAAPRILIALVLAVTISKPLEIKLFDGSITKQMGQTEDAYNKACEESFTAQRAALDQKKADLQQQLVNDKQKIYLNDPVYKGYQDEQQAKQNDIATKNATISSNADIIEKNIYEVEVPADSLGNMKTVRRYNELAKQKLQENRDLRADIAIANQAATVLGDSMTSRKGELTNQVKVTEKQSADQQAGVQKQIDDLNNRRPEIFAKCKSDAAVDKDILARLRALSELKTFGNSVWWASLMITLLFVLLETAPITVKLLAKRGPYDEILDRIEYEVLLAQQKIISDKNSEVNQLLEEIKVANKLKGEIRIKTEQAKIDAELRANESLLKDISDKVATLASMQVEKWYKDEVSKMNAAGAGSTN